AMELAHHISNAYATNYYFLDLTMFGQPFLQDDTSSKKNIQSVGSEHYTLFTEKEAQLYE
ncbi:22344_t:CDS:1, partial [Gigaspora margarita]